MGEVGSIGISEIGELGPRVVERSTEFQDRFRGMLFKVEISQRVESRGSPWRRLASDLYGYAGGGERSRTEESIRANQVPEVAMGLHKFVKGLGIEMDGIELALLENEFVDRITEKVNGVESLGKLTIQVAREVVPKHVAKKLIRESMQINGGNLGQAKEYLLANKSTPKAVRRTIAQYEVDKNFDLNVDVVGISEIRAAAERREPGLMARVVKDILGRSKRYFISALTIGVRIAFALGVGLSTYDSLVEIINKTVSGADSGTRASAEQLLGHYRSVAKDVGYTSLVGNARKNHIGLSTKPDKVAGGRSLSNQLN